MEGFPEVHLTGPGLETSDMPQGHAEGLGEAILERGKGQGHIPGWSLLIPGYTGTT